MKKCENKDLIFILIQLSEIQGAGRVKTITLYNSDLVFLSSLYISLVKMIKFQFSLMFIIFLPPSGILALLHFICDALRDLLPFV